MPHSPITAGTKVVYQEGVYTVRAVDGNVLELAYHTGDFFRLVHASSVLVCPPPATQTAASLPAPAAGQGAGIDQRRLFAFCAWRCSSLTAFIWAFHSSRSLRRAFFSWTTKYVQIALTVMATPAAAQTMVTISVDGTASPIWMVIAVMVAWTVASLAIFHWLMVPLLGWIADRIVDKQ